MSYAACRGDYRGCKSILSKGANVNIADDYHQTPLYRATWGGYFDICKLLLDHGSNVNIPGDYQETPLYTAAWRGYLDITKLLLDNGANPNISSLQSGRTPIAIAASNKHFGICKYLMLYADLDCSK